MAKKNPNDLLMNGPVPGENFTSDTKNQPWHRPPKFTTVDDAVEYSFEKLLDKKRSQKVLTALEMGVSVVQLTDIYLTSGISQGKWTPDFALLMAGPVAHIIKMMADGYGIEYSMGTDTDDRVPTKTYFDNIKELKTWKPDVKEDIAEALPEMTSEPSTSFLDAPAEEAPMPTGGLL